MALQNNVNHKNMIVMWKYLRGFARERGLSDDDVDIFAMLRLPYPSGYGSALQYYTDPKQWSPLGLYVSCYLKAKEITGDPDFFRNCGRSAARYKSFENWYIIARTLSGPVPAINYLPEVIPDWNDTKIFELVRPARFSMIDQKVKATLKYTFHPEIDPCDDFCSDPHILGLLEAIPQNWPGSLLRPWQPLPFAELEQPLVQYDPIKLFGGRFFKHLNLDPVFQDDQLHLRDPATGLMTEVGRKMVLVSETVDGKEVFLGDYRPLAQEPDPDDVIGVLIEKDLSYMGEPICQKGVVMNAPYFLIHYSCEENPLVRQLWNLRSFFMGNRQLMKELFAANEALRVQVDEGKQKTARIEELYRNLETHYINERRRERIMTGGFAHEVRNKLTASQYQAQNVMDYEDGRSAMEFARRQATELLKAIQKCEREHGLPRDVVAREMVPLIKDQVKAIDFITERLDSIGTGIEHGLEVTRRIRAYSRMQDQKREDDEVDLMAVLNQYATDYETRIKDEGIAYRLASELESAPMPGGSGQLDTIFRNLVLNALDAVADSHPKEVTVALSRHTGDGPGPYRISVSDTGPGIPADKIEEVFDPFYSTKPTTGTGLGLSEARRMVELYGGEISVESTPGKGAAFTVLLPR
jgi:signal transduction histidine kinase